MSAPIQQKSIAARTEIWVIWLAIVALGYVGVYHSLQSEYDHAIAQLEQNLALSAGAQAERVEAKLDGLMGLVDAVAKNASVKLYLSTVNESEAKNVAQASATFLRNYVLTMAQQSELLPLQTQLDEVRANIDYRADRGLAIVRSNMQPMVATNAFPDASRIWTQEAYGGQSIIMVDDSLWFRAPIYPIQSDDAPIGWVLANIPFSSTIEPLLLNKQQPYGALITRLVQEIDGKIETIATIPKQKPVYERSKLMPAYERAFHAPRSMQSGANLHGEASYAYAEPIRSVSWQVVQDISEADALGDLKRRHMMISTIYWMAAFAITLIVIALWRYMVSQRLEMAMRDIKSHEALLEMITDHIPARLMIMDRGNRVRYANREVLQQGDLNADDIVGKKLNQILGPAQAEGYMKASERVLRKGVEESIWHEMEGRFGIETAKDIQLVPLDNLPDKYSAADGGGVLIIEHDLTEVMQSKQSHQIMLDKLVDTLVMLVDQRDPNAANHSAGVAYIATAIADTMALDNLHIEAVSIAGRLMNIGKILVPQALLTSDKRLDDGDRDKIAESLQLAADYLQHIPFEGPVIETIRQSQERIDGSGPLGLKGEFILPTAQILAVANSFVAITSPRSYRDGKNTEEAISILQGQAGVDYSEDVIIALKHYMNNLGGCIAWRHFREDMSAENG